ncbi:MAG TPA: bifunctional acetate--CoA ligase family protein/GNAT family N-acetyltransferase [Bryobacteraceae bacterium]|nr:bifunctional acetate--CoA ligase family protein/GNAT family N-acetyltransferase [Bryobacteraceae bacterium]
MSTSSQSTSQRRAPLEACFDPRTVAVIGATEESSSVGRSIISNLKQAAFGGRIYPVNPNRSDVFGSRCYPTVREVPEPIDLAVIATPAPTVPQIVGECISAGVEGAIIISAGFKEIGERGAALEQDIIRQVRKSKLRIVGPNCLGIMNPYSGLNATFATSMARPGHIGFISQSGALCTAILDWSQRESVGFSAFVSVGSMLDVGWGDLIQYLGDDPNTRSIVIYMESVGDARAFVSAAREVALSKPIIVLKPGRTDAAAKAAASHTGALTGADDVLDAAFRRCGVVRVDSIAELFHLSEALDKRPRPHGPNLTIVTNAGGPAVLAADVLLARGGRLTELSPNTVEELNKFLPHHWSHQNPIDIIGDAGPERYLKAVEVAAKDPKTDGLLLILAPTGLTDPTEVAKRLTPLSKLSGKPVIASWMGGRDVARGDAILSEAGIPTYAYPDAAASVFQLMWSYSANLKALYETPESFESEDPNAAIQAAARAEAARLIEATRSKRRTLLTEAESKIVLAAYGIPTVRTEIATSSDEAVRIANRIGYPVVLKLHSETITHKTEVGGVHLGLRDEGAIRSAYVEIEESVTRIAGREHFLGVTVQPMVRPEGKEAGYELILGSTVDPQFGPILLFGSGGQLVEIYKDRAIGLPPLNTTLAQRLTERTKILAALRGVRGRKPVDLAELERLLVRFSYLVMEQRWIKEIDINPLLASSDGLLALDARVVLHSQDVLEPPRPAIRPYPVQYVKPWRFADGIEVLIRPIRPEDERLMTAFHAKLSERSIYQRYFHMLSLDQRVAHERLVRVCFGDYDREIALVAEHRHPGKTNTDLIAVARLSKAHLLNEAELAVVIIDEFQGRGLGTELFRRLIEIARAEQLERVTVEILAQNRQMIEVCRELGFSLEHAGGDVIHGVLVV